jgi:RHS repeat-associated protein
VLEEKNAGGQVVKSYTLGHDVVSQAVGGGTVYHFLYDGHGSTRALLNAVGVVAAGQRYAYDAYGNMLLGSPTTALTSLLYSGEQTDRTGLQYLRARYYDPRSGRFNRLDPFAGNTSDPQSLHKYLYAHGDPVNGIDPSGEFIVPILQLVASLLGFGFAAYVYENTFSDDAEIVLTTFENARDMAEDAITGLNRWSNADQMDYRKWFGTPTQMRRDGVRDAYMAIKEELDKNFDWWWGETYWQRDDTSPAFAYVYKGGYVEIFFGQAFWTALATGTDSQAGTVIHELSHELWDTDDYVYGTTNAKLLARTRPDLALDNADNYEYFAEKAP